MTALAATAERAGRVSAKPEESLLCGLCGLCVVLGHAPCAHAEADA
jgi:hypothetical protein